MNPASNLDEESGLRGRTQNLARRAFRTDDTPISLPKKEELLLLIHLNRIHENRQKLPAQPMEHVLTFPLIRVK